MLEEFMGKRVLITTNDCYPAFPMINIHMSGIVVESNKLDQFSNVITTYMQTHYDEELFPYFEKLWGEGHDWGSCYGIETLSCVPGPVALSLDNIRTIMELPEGSLVKRHTMCDGPGGDYFADDATIYPLFVMHGGDVYMWNWKDGERNSLSMLESHIFSSK